MRVTIEFNERGELDAVCTDGPADVFVVARHCPRDRSYLLTEIHKVGVHHVQESLGGVHIGHLHDGLLDIGEDTSPRLPPSKPKLRVIE